MVNIGDVWAIVATIGGVFVTCWALVLLTSVLLSQRANLASDALRDNWGKCLIRGFLVAAVGIFVSIVLLSLPNPPAKLLGWIALTNLLAVGVLGIAGAARLLASRLRELDENRTELSRLSLASVLLLASANVPLLGWFFLAPILLILGVGSGVVALRTQIAEPTPVAEA